MLIVTDHNVLDKLLETINFEDGDKTKIFNISSLKEGYRRLNILPLNYVSYVDEKQFDMDYANFLLNNDSMFVEFFTIINELYLGNNVILLVTFDPGFDYITESLTKLIQQRYGYNTHYINSIEDLYDIEDSTEFSFGGLYNLDIDKERYILLTYGR